jgi:hypothetical protein
MEKQIYISTDDNKYLNTKYIRWVKQMNECMEVCSMSNGCVSGISTHTVCKKYSSDSYETLKQIIAQR